MVTPTNIFPFNETVLGNDTFLRTFDNNTIESELVWHQDPEDRVVLRVGSSDWKFQFDEELPLNFPKVVFIPKLKYHRVIKGEGVLTVLVKKLK